MTRLRTHALLVLSLIGMTGCSFKASYSTGTKTSGGEIHESAPPAHASHDKGKREHRDYTAPPAHEVACTSGDDAARQRCEERKRRAQENLDAIDREQREREEQAERDARREEEEAE